MELTNNRVVIIDYGIGNLGSVHNMLKKCGLNAIRSCKQEDVMTADKLILSGVGAFDVAMDNLNKSGLLPHLEEKVLNRGTPILGICVGMQVLTRGSEEGRRSGLGWLDAEVIRFRQSDFPSARRAFRIPHMGWNVVRPIGESLLFNGFEGAPRFYFVHSYHLECDYKDAVGMTDYGYEFVSAIQHGNITGVQFHPEKSHRYGYTLLKNFAGPLNATPCDPCSTS